MGSVRWSAAIQNQILMREFTMNSTITDRLLGLFGDPLFWIGSVFVGILINVIGNYLTRYSDTFIAKVSLRKQLKLEMKQQEISKAVDRLLASPTERFDVKLDVLFYMLQRVLWGIGLTVSIILAYLFALLEKSSASSSMSILFVILSLYAYARAYSYRKLLDKDLEIITHYNELIKGGKGTNANITTNKSDEAI
jgi:hypothetical protein